MTLRKYFLWRIRYVRRCRLHLQHPLPKERSYNFDYIIVVYITQFYVHTQLNA